MNRHQRNLGGILNPSEMPFQPSSASTHFSLRPCSCHPHGLTKLIQAVASEDKERRVRDGEIIFLDTPLNLFRMKYSFPRIYFCTSVRIVLYSTCCARGGTELSFSWILDAVAIRIEKALGLCCHVSRLNSMQTRWSMDCALRTVEKTLGAQPHQGPFLGHYARAPSGTNEGTIDNCQSKRHSSRARQVALVFVVIVYLLCLAW